MGFGRSPHGKEEGDQDKGYHGGQLRQVQQAEAGGRKHRSLAMSNSSNSLVISHLNRSLPLPTGKQKLRVGVGGQPHQGVAQVLGKVGNSRRVHRKKESHNQ